MTAQNRPYAKFNYIYLFCIWSAVYCLAGVFSLFPNKINLSDPGLLFLKGQTNIGEKYRIYQHIYCQNKIHNLSK